MASTSADSRCEDISYGSSTPLALDSSTYFWRIKFWDLADHEGDWSTTTASFTTREDNYLQYLQYGYDTVGNITQIIDSSNIDNAKKLYYDYDDLYRLTRASSTNAVNGQDYLRTYGYNAIGNITNKSDIGNYSYADSGYSNPHAATNINGATYAYDNNGNLASDGTWTHTWDYNNRLIGSTNGSTTIAYGYDHTGARVLMDNGTDAYHYPNRYYNLSGATSTKHVFANNELVATIEGNGTTSTTYYIHSDHLGGSSVVTYQDGNLVQTLDYYPYGGIRLDERSGNIDEKRKAFGHEYDSDSELYYMRARYQNPATGRFISIDPVFNDIGINYDQFDARYGQELEQLLSDPQMLNSYAYARNNPVVNYDPTGNLTFGALVSHPIDSFKHVVSWGYASLGLNLVNRPFAASLLRHSASLSPGDITINSSNQKQYGNPIDKIMQTDQYKNYINQTIEKAQNGETSNTGYFKFENKSDLYYSLYRTKIESQVTKENGEWVVSNTVTDRYDFNPTDPQTYKGTVTRIPATQAYSDQQSGYLSNYDISIKFSDKIKE